MTNPPLSTTLASNVLRGLLPDPEKGKKLEQTAIAIEHEVTAVLVKAALKAATLTMEAREIWAPGDTTHAETVIGLVSFDQHPNKTAHDGINFHAIQTGPGIHYSAMIESLGFLQRKALVLLDDPVTLSSYSGRDPNNGIWGGMVGFDLGSWCVVGGHHSIVKCGLGCTRRFEVEDMMIVTAALVQNRLLRVDEALAIMTPAWQESERCAPHFDQLRTFALTKLWTRWS